MKTIGRCVLAVLVASVLSPTTYGVILTDDPSLPPEDGVFRMPPPAEVLYQGSGFNLVLKMPEIQVVDVRQKEEVGGDERAVFGTVLHGAVMVNGGPSMPVMLSGVMETLVMGKMLNDTTGTWDTELISMNLTGDIGGMPVVIRESPTMSSSGQTEVRSLRGGTFQVDSFFDISTEVSVDGGPFIPAAAPARVNLEPFAVPEPAGVLLLGMGMVGLCARRRTA